MKSTKRSKKIKKVYGTSGSDTSGMGMKPNKTYTFSSLNVEKEIKENKVVKEKDVFELPKKKSGY